MYLVAMGASHVIAVDLRNKGNELVYDPAFPFTAPFLPRSNPHAEELYQGRFNFSITHNVTAVYELLLRDPPSFPISSENRGKRRRLHFRQLKARDDT